MAVVSAAVSLNKSQTMEIMENIPPSADFTSKQKDSNRMNIKERCNFGCFNISNSYENNLNFKGSLN